MKCPHCGLTNPEGALRCDCGYDFHSEVIKESYLTKSGASLPTANRTASGLGHAFLPIWPGYLIAAGMFIISFAGHGSDAERSLDPLVLKKAWFLAEM
jgi:hypothetical protein